MYIMYLDRHGWVCGQFAHLMSHDVMVRLIDNQIPQLFQWDPFFVHHLGQTTRSRHKNFACAVHQVHDVIDIGSAVQVMHGDVGT